MRRGRAFGDAAVGLALLVALVAPVWAQAPPPPAYAKQDTVGDFDRPDVKTPEVPVATEALEPRPVPGVVDRYRADPDFQYANPEAKGPSLWDRFWEWVRRTFWDPVYESTTPDARKTVLVILAVLALGWVVARLLRSDGYSSVFSRPDAATPGVGLLDVEDIAAVDLGVRLREALAAGDHREAVRVRYLSVLQALDGAGALAWRPDKTNRQYVGEVAQAAPALADPFRQATRVFDAVWYGERPVSASRYDRLAPLFDAATPREVLA